MSEYTKIATVNRGGYRIDIDDRGYFHAAGVDRAFGSADDAAATKERSDKAEAATKRERVELKCIHIRRQPRKQGDTVARCVATGIHASQGGILRTPKSDDSSQRTQKLYPDTAAAFAAMGAAIDAEARAVEAWNALGRFEIELTYRTPNLSTHGDRVTALVKAHAAKSKLK